MAHAEISDRLGPLDTLFLYIEKKEMPLHIGSVFILDGQISADTLKALIQTKLPLIPRYQQRIVFPPLNLGYPAWEWDPDFDIDRHILHTRIKSGTLASLERLAGTLFGEIMDRNRPLWDLTLVDGLRGGRSALVARVHHCLVDGVAGVALMNLILDKRQEAPATPPAKIAPRRETESQANLLDSFVNSYFHGLNRVLSMQSATLEAGGMLLQELLQGSLPQPATALPEAFQSLDPFPFKAPSLGPRKVCWTEFPLAHANAISVACGVKLNDVLLTALGDAMRRYAKLHRLSVKNRVLRLMVPVNLRGPHENGALGNRISLVPANVPLDIKDTRELVQAVHQRTEALKHAHAAELMVLGGTLLAMLPVPVQALLTGILSNVVPVLPFDMVCTNVPGPQYPLYLLGRKMLTYYPYVPIGDFMGVCCAMASYNGTLYFGLTGDAACAPDLDRLRDFLDEALQDLLQRSGCAPLLARRKSKPTDGGAPPKPVAPIMNEAPLRDSAPPKADLGEAIAPAEIGKTA